MAKFALLVSAIAFQTTFSCEIVDVSPSSVFSSDIAVVKILGAGFGQVESAHLLQLTNGFSNISVSWNDGYLEIPANSLQTGELYGVELSGVSGESLCSLTLPKGIFAYGAVASIQSYFLGKGTWHEMQVAIEEANPVLNIAGKQSLFLLAENLFSLRREEDLVVKFDDLLGTTTSVQGKLVTNGGDMFVEVVTPALKITKEQCPKHPDPTCLRPVRVSLSLDGGQAFSTAFETTFAYKKPVEIGFLFRSLESDEWSKQTNIARLELQDVFGDSIDTTLVKETVDMEVAYNQMIAWCKQGVDIIMPTSNIYSAVARSAASAEDCEGVKFAGMGTSKSRMTDTFSRAYGRTYETRYLAGMAAGFMQEKTGSKCVGFIAPDLSRTNSVVEQINAVVLGCREAYSDCLVKVIFVKDFYNPSVERDASAYLFNKEGCSILVVNTDSVEPQKYMKSVAGYSLGYNFEMRQTFGDSILTSELIRWLPMMVDFVRQVIDKNWQKKTQLLYGLSKGGVDIDLLFSPELSGDMQLRILKKRSDIQLGKEKIYSREKMRMRWLIKREDGKLVTCNGENSRSFFSWERLNQTREINETLFLDGAISDDDLISADPMDGVENIGINDYMLDGVEIAQPGSNLWGGIRKVRQNEDGSCSFGDGVFEQTADLPECLPESFPLSEASCNSETALFEFTFNNTETCGLELNAASKYLSVNATPKVIGDIDCNYVPESSSSGIIGFAISVAGASFNFLIAVLLFRYRRAPSVRLTQPNIVILMSIGGILLCLSNLLFLGEASEFSCVARVIGFNLGFDFIFTMLVGKIYRIIKLFSEVKKLRRIVLKDKDVILGALALVSIDAVILGLWTGIPRFRPRPIENELQFTVSLDTLTWTDSVTYFSCGSEEDFWKFLTLSYKMVLVIIACAYAFWARDVPSNFLEHRFITFSAYNALLFSGVVILITSSASPQIAFIVHCIGTSFGSTIVNGLLAVPPLLLATNIWSVSSLGSSEGSETASEQFGNPQWNASFFAPPMSFSQTKTFSGDREDDRTESF